MCQSCGSHLLWSYVHETEYTNDGKVSYPEGFSLFLPPQGVLLLYYYIERGLMKEAYVHLPINKYLLYCAYLQGVSHSTLLSIFKFQQKPVSQNDTCNESLLWISASLVDLRGMGSSHAINCGGVLSIRMNNLKGVLIGIPDMAKGRETKCCWKTFHYFPLWFISSPFGFFGSHFRLKQDK